MLAVDFVETIKRYSDFRPAALALAQRALAAAAIFARAAALILRRVVLRPFPFPFTLAQRALCAAAILARALALIVRLPFPDPAAPPKIFPSSFSSESICSLIAAARLNCSAERLLIDFIRYY